MIVTVDPSGPAIGLRPPIPGVTVKATPALASPPTVTTTLPVVAPDGTVTVIEVALQLVGVAEVPLKVTVDVPCAAPKLVPVIVTVDPSGPLSGLKLPMAGGTVKVTPLLATSPTVTTTLPVVAPTGTVTVMEVSLQLVGVAAVPLKVTVLVPRVAPKPVPLIVTEVPSGPEAGLKPLMPSVTVNATPALASPSTVTTTLPVVAPAGTVTVIEVSAQLLAVAEVPLKVTFDVPCAAPKLVPVISTEVPTGPSAGLNPPIAGVTLKATPALAVPPAVTTTLPVVAPIGTATVIEVSLQLVGVAAVPLKATVLVPCVAPKFTPVIVTDVPSGPESGFSVVMLGSVPAVTVNSIPAVATPPIVTTTSPVVAPAGTSTSILLFAQLT